MSSTPIDEWKKIAAYHRAALEKAEAQIKQLENPVDIPLMDDDMEGHAGYKYIWKRVITKENIVDDVSSIFNDCYDILCDKNERGVTNADEIGISGSLMWHLFTLKVIKYLKERGSY